MAKPIFIVKTPMYFSTEERITLENFYSNKLNDYHVILIPNNKIKNFKFKVYSEKEFSELDDKKLKEVIEKINNKDEQD